MEENSTKPLSGVAIADLLAVLEPVLDWYQSDEEALREPLDILSEIVADLEEDRIELLALAKDKRRLDWLDDPENRIGNVQLPVGAVTENVGSLRDAIDAAMSGDYERNAPLVEPGYSANEH